MSRQALVTAVGLTHASSVMPLVRRSDVASATVTLAFVPLKLSAFPYLPWVVQVALLMVPEFPLPERSVVFEPEPSLNEYAATRLLAEACVVAVAVLEYGPRLDAASTARTR
jgi:hypothetical protein